MWNRKSTPASSVALGGVLAALALVIMGLGGMIPVATYVLPVIAMLLLKVVLKICGRRVAWAWYGAVAILSVLICPDPEAAFVFVFIGYYPILKPWMDSKRGGIIYKILLFNGTMLVLYWSLMHIMGMTALQQEFSEMGNVMVILLLILGNLTFFMLDFVLGKGFRRRRAHG